MAIANNQRPGVYSSYTVSSGYSAPRSERYAALVCKADESFAGRLYTLTAYTQAAGIFSGSQSCAKLLAACKILFNSGVSGVIVSAVAGDYAPALALIQKPENIGILVTDAQSPEDLALVRESVKSASDALRERIAFFGADSADEALNVSLTLNHERAVVCCPKSSPSGMDDASGFYSACAMAGAVLAKNDCAYNFSGQALETVHTPDVLDEADIQRLLSGGVTVFEEVGGNVECIRAQTTRTSINGVTDRGMRSINTIMIIDEVMSSIRGTLKKRLRGARIAETSLQSVASQVTVELAAFRDMGILTGFDMPLVSSDTSDPTICAVSLAFSVAHMAEQIHITAHIQV